MALAIRTYRVRTARPLGKSRYCLTVSLIVAVSVATDVLADAWAYLLVLQVPSLSFGSSPENMNTAVPVPVAPANLPVLLAPW